MPPRSTPELRSSERQKRGRLNSGLRLCLPVESVFSSHGHLAYKIVTRMHLGGFCVPWARGHVALQREERPRLWPPRSPAAGPGEAWWHSWLAGWRFLRKPRRPSLLPPSQRLGVERVFGARGPRTVSGRVLPAFSQLCVTLTHPASLRRGWVHRPGIGLVY